MHKDDLVYIDHINESINKIREYTKEFSKEDFEKNELIQDAVIRNFEIIGEAAKRISDSFKQTYREIPWKEMSGMRDKLIHDYMGVDICVIWKTIQDDLPVFENFLKNIE
ncbi:MAG: DUF86 domain-containing protein [Bacteroidales bacterium]